MHVSSVVLGGVFKGTFVTGEASYELLSKRKLVQKEVNAYYSVLCMVPLILLIPQGCFLLPSLKKDVRWVYCGNSIKCTRPDVSCGIVCFGEQMVTPVKWKLMQREWFQTKKALFIWSTSLLLLKGWVWGLDQRVELIPLTKCGITEGPSGCREGGEEYCWNVRERGSSV